ncbi:helix-turn-helix domain-containing protein [Coralliovum pocilloporae]|uniref:helix-turn-helix domain-containing protein n=1 Tax=Coralliovum pocilloporae TaxID=3066369 RepID=UPI0033078837
MDALPGRNNGVADELLQYSRSGDDVKITESVFDSHETIFFEGDPSDRVYEIVDGVVMLYKLLPDGRRQVVEILGAGDIFGMASSDLYDTSAETLAPATIRHTVRRQAEQSEGWQQHMYTKLLHQLEDMHEHAVLLGRKSAFERVSTFLMKFVIDRGGVGCVGPKLDAPDESLVTLKMTRQEIADYLGLTIETVSRVLSTMKKRGLIVMPKQDRILIKNVCGMCHMTGMHE